MIGYGGNDRDREQVGIVASDSNCYVRLSINVYSLIHSVAAYHPLWATPHKFKKTGEYVGAGGQLWMHFQSAKNSK